MNRAGYTSAMAPPLLTVQDIFLTFGGTPLLEGAELFVFEGDRLCLVGRNGSGKSTLLKIAGGLVEADTGERFVQPGRTVRYLEQDPDLSAFDSVLDYVSAGLAPGDNPHRATYLLDQLGVSPDTSPATLSGGEARRAAIVRVLAPEPDILLLDEPTNHLDLPAITWLEKELARLKSAIVLISHDRRFLTNLTRRTTWLDRGETRSRDHGFESFEAWRDEYYEAEELESHKLDRKIVAEEHWVRYGVTARRKRNQRRMRELSELRRTRREARKATGSVVMSASEGKTSGKLVAEAEEISKTYGDRTIVSKFSIRIERGDRIGIAGPNGAGKTTLLNMLTGTLDPDEGGIRHGANIEMISLDQRRASLKPDVTLAEALTEGRGDMVSVGGHSRHVMSYMKDFLFKPEQARSPVSALSGGERGRLALAIALAKPSNLLVLDEPTNDLDLETLDLLEEMLAAYEGTVLLVSHDRDFLDRIVTSLISIEENDRPGTWREYAGGYSDMMDQRAGARKDKAPAKEKAAKSAKSQSTPKPDTPRAQVKLSFKEKYALETLPARMAELEEKIAEAKALLADPKLFAKDPARFNAAAKTLEQAEEDLAKAEEEWLELELKRETLESSSRS
jgi:ATP-binding cassette subfamily F protein uup